MRYERSDIYAAGLCSSRLFKIIVLEIVSAYSRWLTGHVAPSFEYRLAPVLSDSTIYSVYQRSVVGDIDSANATLSEMYQVWVW